MTPSPQTFFCRACGESIYASVDAPFHAVVCDEKCWEELEWLRMLSRQGRDYEPRHVVQAIDSEVLQ